MSLPEDDKYHDGNTREIGAVRADPAAVEAAHADAAQERAALAERDAQSTRVFDEVTEAEVRADVAQTETRRLEEDRDEAKEEAERAESERDERELELAAARRREQEAQEDAEDVRQLAERTGVVGASAGRAQGFRGPPAGEPIVFGPFTAERPELLVLAAFAGGFVLAKLIRRMAG